MLKLIKYEMIHSYKSFVLVFGLFLAGCIITPLLPYDISAIGMGILMVAVFGISIAVFVTIVRNYNTSMFKKPGYLTLTLPVSSHKLLMSKIISALIWTMISSMILGIGLLALMLIAFDKQGYTITIFELFEEISYVLKYADMELVMQMLTQLVIAGILSIVGIFALITSVQTKYTRKHKTVLAFVIYIAYSFLMAILSNSLYPEALSSLQSNSYRWITTLINCVQIVVLYFLTVYLLDHKIEIE